MASLPRGSHRAGRSIIATAFRPRFGRAASWSGGLQAEAFAVAIPAGIPFVRFLATRAYRDRSRAASSAGPRSAGGVESRTRGQGGSHRGIVAGASLVLADDGTLDLVDVRRRGLSHNERRTVLACSPTPPRALRTDGSPSPRWRIVLIGSDPGEELERSRTRHAHGDRRRSEDSVAGSCLAVGDPDQESRLRSLSPATRRNARPIFGRAARGIGGGPRSRVLVWARRVGAGQSHDGFRRKRRPRRLGLFSTILGPVRSIGVAQ